MRENRCLCQPVTCHPHALFSLGGQLVFEISYRGRAVQIGPSPQVFDGEFRQQVRAWLLFFQEQIKGPENAPIARFDGLGCYQTGSEMGDACGARGQR